MHSILEIKSLNLPVRIGKQKKERNTAQNICFSIKIGFKKAPTDEEQKDFSSHLICYQSLCEQIKTLTEESSFVWIETLAKQVVQKLKALLPKEVALQVCVHKKPKVLGLKGGVSYICGDQF